MWEEAIERERREIVRSYERNGAARASVNPFGPVVYSVNISKTCVPVSANAAYVWRVRWEGAQAPDRPANGEPRQPAAGGGRTMFRRMTFRCSGGGGGWRCP